MTYYSLDCETGLIGPDGLFPPLVCVTICDDDMEPEIIVPWEHDVEGIVRAILEEEGAIIIGANTGYDMGVLSKAFPNLIPAIHAAYAADKIFDVQVTEMLNTLKASGQVTMIELPDGSKQPTRFSLLDLERKYLGMDREEDKKGADSWRLRYIELLNVPLKEWPKEALSYALEDSVTPLAIHLKQKRHPQETLRARGRYALSWMTEIGVATDEETILALDEKVEAAMDWTQFDLLIESGILVAPSPPRPHARRAKNHVDGCPKKDCDCPVKMTAGTKVKKSSKTLRAFMLNEAMEHDLSVPLTDKGQKEFYEETGERRRKLEPDHEWWEENPGTAGTDSGQVARLAAFGSETMRELEKRNEFEKLATTYIPGTVLKDEEGEPIAIADRVRFPFGILKETGRTSSNKSTLFPSLNGQNIDPRMRNCFVADPGWVIASIDYAQLELRTLADFNYKTFGHSVMRDLFIAGIDLHSYLGGSLARYSDKEFSEVCDGMDLMETYEVFMAMESKDFDWFDAKRTYAKPNGLGFPGGLGAATMIEFAYKSYGITMTLEQAKEAKRVWLETFPEMVEYFAYINNKCIDPMHAGEDPVTKEKKKRYIYTTPLGLVRPNCAYPSASNGLGMQSYAADGAQLAIWNLHDACYNIDAESDLRGCRPFNFVHDEFLLHIPYDGDCKHATLCAWEASRIMCESMAEVVTDVPITAEPAFMRVWDKKAKLVEENGIILPWSAN